MSGLTKKAARILEVSLELDEVRGREEAPVEAPHVLGWKHDLSGTEARALQALRGLRPRTGRGHGRTAPPREGDGDVIAHLTARIEQGIDAALVRELMPRPRDVVRLRRRTHINALVELLEVLDRDVLGVSNTPGVLQIDGPRLDVDLFDRVGVVRDDVHLVARSLHGRVVVEAVAARIDGLILLERHRHAAQELVIVHVRRGDALALIARQELVDAAEFMPLLMFPPLMRS